MTLLSCDFAMTLESANKTSDKHLTPKYFYSYLFFISISATCILQCTTYIFSKSDWLWYWRYSIFISFILYYIMYYVLLLGITFSPQHDFNAFFFLILKCMPVYMTEATLNANNNVDICSISSKFHMWMYGRINTYMYKKSMFRIPLSF